MRGRNRRQSATVQLDQRGISKARDVLLVWMDSETLVVPWPEATVVGVKVAVEPGGIPLAVSVIAAGKVVLNLGVTIRL